MTHEELQDRLLDLAYGELSPGDAREVEAHVAACDGCRAELARMQGTRRVMSSLPQVAAPDDGRAVLVAAAREAARVRAPDRRWSVLLRDVALAASLLAVGMVAWRLLTVRPAAEQEDRGGLAGHGPSAEPPPPVAAAPQAPAPPTVAQAPASAEEKAAAAHAPRRERAAKKAESREAASAGPAQDLAVANAAPRSAPAAAAPPAPMAGALALRSEQTPEPEGERRELARQRAAALAAPPPAGGAGAGRVAAKAMVSAKPSAADAAEVADPVARYEALRSAGKLRADFRMAPGCTVEAWRRVERDPDGRIAAYAWDEVRDGRRVVLEVVYGPDGAVAARRARDAETRAPVAVEFAAPAAAGIDLDAPARCR